LPSHAEITAGFAAALFGRAPPPGLAAPDPAELARRFAVYRNNVQHGLGRALAARFPVVERLVGVPFFAAMASEFLRAHPPRQPVIHEWGGDFPAFLAAFPPVAGLPYLADVAVLEVLRGEAYHAADAAPVDPARLLAGDPDGLVVALHPSLRLFASDFPAVTIWQANQPASHSARVAASGPERALIARDRGLDVVVERIDAPAHRLVDALAGGTPLGRAAAGDDPAPALALLIRHGLIVAARHLDARQEDARQGDAP
jgi:hypothetical protein